MPSNFLRPLVAILATLAFVVLVQAAEKAPTTGKPVDFTREIKPILSNHCLACHGPDQAKRKAGLRLDVRDSAVKNAIKPGDAGHSELIARIVTKEDSEVMPPITAKKSRLNAEQVDLLRRWIDQGAKFDTHWAYVKPVRTSPPEVKNTAWPLNAIDRFVAARHEQLGLGPAADADPITLVRRLSFDLTGLPPSAEEVEEFLKATAKPSTGSQPPGTEAYEKLIDQLLASKHFGERMAIYWLDLVRFADTDGYHADNFRNIALYRDYVIDAFNTNKSFADFTIEQLAGDLLPNRTESQWIASGYNRLLMTTEEGGAQAKEYTAKYAADRVRNVSAVWLAGTMGCAECHNHKFDPFTSRDFYSMAAFFADVQEVPVGRQPVTSLPSPLQTNRLKRLDERLVTLRAELSLMTPEREAALVTWLEQTRTGAQKSLPKPLAALLDLEPAQRTPENQKALADHWRTIALELDPNRKALAAVQSERDQVQREIPTTLVSMAGAPRTIRILPRGNWLDDSGEIVRPAMPAFLPAPEFKDRPTRLDLARWMVSRDNPLTARVFVNRLWKICFGQGLVKSLEDFGAQGNSPSHPELLDWLAVEFVESGWNVKHLLKLMVSSRTYRQSSALAKTTRETDPTNIWLTRQGRWRLDAEMIRDNALAVSGLLCRKIGGPSAKPYQPAGYWSFLNFPKREYVADQGEGLYRRGLYTFWQRTFPHPSLIAFDAPSREECTAERPRSSTPLQALVLLNDPIYVEAARALAEDILREPVGDPSARATRAFHRVLSRTPRADELALLVNLYAKHKSEYTQARDGANKLIATGAKPVAGGMDPAEMAAWTSVTRVLLNLHETITRN